MCELIIIRAFFLLTLINTDLFRWVRVYDGVLATYSEQHWWPVYAPQLGARLHLTNTQLNIVGLAANGV